MIVSRSRLRVEQAGRVLTVEFDNPPRNFFDERTSFELDDLTRELERDRSIRAVVFSGRDTFVTHFNVPDLLRGSRSAPAAVTFRQARAVTAAAGLVGHSRALDRLLSRTPARDLLMSARVYRSLRRMNRIDKVLVAAINGMALGMGCIFALACDIRLMADGYPIGLVESGIAILAGAGGTQRIVRMVGSSRGLELLLSGRWMPAAEAADIGLVHAVVPAERLRTEALALAERMSARPPALVREVKRMAYDAATRPFAAALRMEAASMAVTVASAEAERAMDAYVSDLAQLDPLTDDAILAAWRRLLV